MQTHDFYYDLPKELIAQTPIEPRDHSRLLVYHKDNQKIEHKHFYDIVDYLKAGDVLVINDTKVYPARIYGTRLGENVTKELNTEVLLLKRQDYLTWECITRPAKKLKIGTKIKFSDELTGEVVGYADEGIRYIKFEFEGIFEDILDRIGQMPLPPYITKKLEDKTRYNTVYAEHLGSAAAPTAGLHFTKELLQKVQDMGVIIAHVTLDVGLGTFRPVKEDNILNHDMHTEYFEVSEEVASIINKAKAEHRRIFAVGTTSVRTLESAVDKEGKVVPQKNNTKLFCYPPYDFKIVDCLITNFHLPESTLIMLVSAFAGYENTMNVYKTAVQEKYRFFSFGDACLFYRKMQNK